VVARRDIVRRFRSGSTPHERNRPVTTPECRSHWPLAIDWPRRYSANDQRCPPSRALGHPARTSTSALARSAAALSRCEPCPAITTPKRHRTTSGSQIPIGPARGTAVPMPARGFLVWGFFCQRVSARRRLFFPSTVSLFDLKARFFVPTRAPLTSARAGAVKVGRRVNLAACSALARPHLDSFEHDGTLAAIGMTIRGEPACGRESIAPQPCIRWVQGPEP
jgi:hypothetical protein